MISLSSSGLSFRRYSLGPLWTSPMRRVFCPSKCMQINVWVDLRMRRNIVLHVVLLFRWSISQLLYAAMTIDGVRPVFLQRMTLKLFVARCSITTFILSTPWVRTCIGCSRKAFLPLSMRTSPEQPSWLPMLARGWVVEELLEAVRRCLYCNNTFVRVL